MQEDVSMQLTVNNRLGENIYIYVYPTKSRISIPDFLGSFLWNLLSTNCLALAASGVATLEVRRLLEQRRREGDDVPVPRLIALIEYATILTNFYNCAQPAVALVNQSRSMSVTVLARSSKVIDKDALTGLISTDGITAVLRSKSVNLSIQSGDQLINLYGVDQADTINVGPDGAVKVGSSTPYSWNGSQCIYQKPDNVCYVTREKTFYIFQGAYFFTKTNADKYVSGPFSISDKFPGLMALPAFKDTYPKICYQKESKSFWFFSNYVFYTMVDGQKSFSGPKNIVDIFPGVPNLDPFSGDVAYNNNRKKLIVFNGENYYTKVGDNPAQGPFVVRDLTCDPSRGSISSITYNDDAKQFWLFDNTDCWIKTDGQRLRGPFPVARQFPCTSESIAKQKAEMGDL
jgi:hypothetical protein